MNDNRILGVLFFLFIVGGTIYAMLNAFNGEVFPLIVVGSLLVGFIVLWSDILLGFGFFSALYVLGDLFKKLKSNN